MIYVHRFALIQDIVCDRGCDIQQHLRGSAFRSICTPLDLEPEHTESQQRPAPGSL